MTDPWTFLLRYGTCAEPYQGDEWEFDWFSRSSCKVS